jgi:methionyl-tRNA formyltransferase
LLRYAVVVSSRRNYASLFVLRTLQVPIAAKLLAVVYCHGALPATLTARTRVKRKIRKSLRLGVLGTLNGLRLRRWYGSLLADRLRCPDLQHACASAAVPFLEIHGFWDERGRDRLRALDLDIALSLGNGIIPSAFFRIPRLGMLNVHHELLPEYRGAQTVLWQLHDASRTTGYSVHEITERLDAGRILLREQVPIQWRGTLKHTVIDTTAEVQSRSIDGLLRVLDGYEGHLGRAIANDGKTLYTTPTTGAMLRIYRNYFALRPSSLRASASG